MRHNPNPDLHLLKKRVRQLPTQRHEGCHSEHDVFDYAVPEDMLTRLLTSFGL